MQWEINNDYFCYIEVRRGKKATNGVNHGAVFY